MQPLVTQLEFWNGDEISFWMGFNILLVSSGWGSGIDGVFDLKTMVLVFLLDFLIKIG